MYFKSAGITVCILFQVLESINSSYLVSPQIEQSLQQISSQFPDSLRLDSLEKSSETKVRKLLCFTSFFFYMAGAGQTVNFSVASMEDIQLNLHLNRHMSRMFRPQPIMVWKDKF